MDTFLEIIIGIQPVFSILLAVIVFGHRLRIRKLENQPEIVGYLDEDELRENQIILRIENIGKGIAYNVQFEVDPDFYPLTENHPSFGDLGFFKNGIKRLSPGRKIEVPILTTNKWEELMKNPIEIICSYENSKGKPYPSINFEFHCNEFENVFQRKTLDGGLVKELKNGLKPLEEVSKELRTLNERTNSELIVPVGSRVKICQEITGFIDDDFRHIITIPKGEICIVHYSSFHQIILEWESAPEEIGRVVHRGSPWLGLFERIVL